ncbi:MAG: hypothetical protein ACE10B_06430, partial [Phycisphaerales bacterium]
GTMEPSNFPDDIDPSVRRVILHCLKKDANKRPSSALAVEAALSASASPANRCSAGTRSPKSGVSMNTPEQWNPQTFLTMSIQSFGG